MGNRLRQLTVLWGRVRRRRDRRKRPLTFVTALDIEGLTMRLVQSGPRDRVIRLEVVPLEIGPEADRNDPVVLGAAIARALGRLDVKPGTVVMGVPRARVMLRTLTVPVLEKLAELASLVHLQVAKDLPFRMDEAVIDFKVRRQVFAPPDRLESSGKPNPTIETVAVSPRLEVLVATVKREVVDFHLRLAEAAGLQLSALGLLPYANARCVEACHIADGDQAFALVSLRPDEVGIDIIAQQSLLFSRGATIRPLGDAGVAVGGSPSTSASQEHQLQSIVIEVVRSLNGYAGMATDPPVTKVVVAGATGLEDEVVTRLAGRLTTPCTRLNPAALLKLPDGSKEHAPGSVGALGLAFGAVDPQRLPFDFLNPKRPAVARDSRRIRLLAGVASAVLLVVAVLGVKAWLIRGREKVLASVAADLAEAEKKRPSYRRLTQQTAVVDDWISAQHDWLAHYAYLTSILPPTEEIYLTSLAVGGQGQIQLNVQARSGETLARLEKQLHAAGYEVKPLAITPGADRFGYEFRSTVELLVPDKLPIDLRKMKPPARPPDDMSLEPGAYRRGGG